MMATEFYILMIMKKKKRYLSPVPCVYVRNNIPDNECRPRISVPTSIAPELQVNLNNLLT